MKPNGVILVDNVLWSGRVADPTADDDQTSAIRRFNDHVAADARVDCVMLAISDGLTLLRKH
jgi:caffeoyl-CoA O-methyltransferase